ncbi:putative transposase for IS1106A3 [Neisseria meningitidis NM607]|nr:putative transposase for IS1106A3 [Neisseria meningitidis NM607]
MSTFFQQTAQAMIAKHIDRFPLLKLDQVIDWQPIEQYLNRQKTRYLRDHRGRPAYPCCPCSKPSCSDNGTASPIPNSNTASSPASTSTCFAV